MILRIHTITIDIKWPKLCFVLINGEPELIVYLKLKFFVLRWLLLYQKFTPIFLNVSFLSFLTLKLNHFPLPFPESSTIFSDKNKRTVKPFPRFSFLLFLSFFPSRQSLAINLQITDVPLEFLLSSHVWGG